MMRWIAGIAIASLLASSLAWPAGSELSRLRAENAQLKAKLEALRQSCPAAASSAAASPVAAAAHTLPSESIPPPATAAVPVAGSAAAVTNAQLPGLSPGATALSPAPVPPPAATPTAPAAAAAAPAAASSAANYAVPSGYQLVPVTPAPEQERYKSTGCDQGLLKGPAPAKWRDDATWKPMHAGMSMSEVEAVLGVEHYDVNRDGVLEWHYGQCGPTAEAVVRFSAGHVDAWRPPD